MSTVPELLPHGRVRHQTAASDTEPNARAVNATAQHQSVWRSVRRGYHQLFGIPDYERYIEHCQRHHPDRPLLSRSDWSRRPPRAGCETAIPSATV